MKVLTESEIRSRLKNKDTNRFVVDSKTIITPSAREYLKAKKIELITNDEIQNNVEENDEDKKNIEFKPKYVCDYSGGYLENKPENMTHIYGNKLVFKDHPSIVFRGKLDSLQSKILLTQLLLDYKNKSSKLIEDLDEVLKFVRNILKSEVLNEKIDSITLFDLDEETIREMSHNPKKHLGVEHILPHHKMGEELITLNSIRSNVREVELSSLPLRREDISKALNRLSSAIYVMMCRYLAGYYKK